MESVARYSTRVGLIALVTGLAIGCCCGMGGVSEEELDDLEQLLEAVDQASEETRLRLLVSGVEYTAVEHGWSAGTCTDAWRAFASASAEQVDGLVADAFPGCTAMCPAGDGARDELLLAMTTVEGRQKIQLVTAACDEEGPDPVFGGDLEDSRWQMALTDYWVLRSALAEVDGRLGAARSDRAAELQAQFADQIPWVAGTLALHWPPEDADVELPGSTATRLPRLAPTVRVDATRIAVDGEPVSALDALDDQLEPLSRALAERASEVIAEREAQEAAWMEAAEIPAEEPPPRKEGKMSRSKGKSVQVDKESIDREIAENAGILASLNDLSGVLGTDAFGANRIAHTWSGPNAGSVLLQADHETPYKRVFDVMSSASEAGFREVQLGVRNLDTQQQAVIEVSQGVWRSSGESPEGAPLRLTVLITEEGFFVAGRAALLTGEGGRDAPSVGKVGPSYMYDELGEMLARVKDEYPDEDTVVVAADVGVPYEVVTRTLDVARVLQRDGEEPARELFRFASLASQEQVLALWRDLGLSVPRALGGQGASRNGDKPAGTGSGALEKETIAKVVKRHKGQIRMCYEQELRASPALSGKVTVSFTIGGTGNVVTASVAESTLNNREVENCLVRRIKRWRFPAPDGGGNVTVNYPFVFQAQ